ATGLQGDLLPTGAVTALIGAPLLLVLLPRLALGAEPPALASERLTRARRPGRLLALLVLGLCVVAVLALLVGPGPPGWRIAFGEDLMGLMPWRLPRIAAALAAGAMLAVAGVMMQRLTGNPMASPEVMGVSAGAAFGMMAALFGLGATGRPALTAAAAAGAF